MGNLKEHPMQWRRPRPKGMSFIRNAIYAVYRNDEMIAMGTADECAEELNVNPEYIHWLTTPTGKKRYESRKNKEKAQTAIVIDWEEVKK